MLGLGFGPTSSSRGGRSCGAAVAAGEGFYEPHCAAAGWRSGADLETEVASLRAAAEATQRCLAQLENKFAARIEQTTQRLIEDALASHRPLTELRQGFSKLQSEQRHLGVTLGQLPSARDVDTVLEQHKTAIETKISDRIEAIEHNTTKQQQALMERLEGRGGETWRTCLQRMSSLEERVVLQTDVNRIIERTLAEVRRAAPELLGSAAASNGVAAVAELRTTTRRLEAKVAGCEARLAAVSEDTCAEGRVWRATVAAKVETLDRAQHDFTSRLIGVEAAQTAFEEGAQRAAEVSEAIAREAKDKAEDAAAVASKAEAEVGQRAEAAVRKRLENLETSVNSRCDSVRRDMEALRLQLQGYDQAVQIAKEDATFSAKDRASTADSMAALRAEVAHLRTYSASAASAAKEGMQNELNRVSAELRHDLQVRVAKSTATFEACSSQLSASVSGFHDRLVSNERRVADLAGEVARAGSVGRTLQQFGASQNLLGAAASEALQTSSPGATHQAALPAAQTSVANTPSPRAGPGWEQVIEAVASPSSRPAAATSPSGPLERATLAVSPTGNLEATTPLVSPAARSGLSSRAEPVVSEPGVRSQESTPAHASTPLPSRTSPMQVPIQASPEDDDWDAPSPTAVASAEREGTLHDAVASEQAGVTQFPPGRPGGLVDTGLGYSISPSEKSSGELRHTEPSISQPDLSNIVMPRAGASTASPLVAPDWSRREMSVANASAESASGTTSPHGPPPATTQARSPETPSPHGPPVTSQVQSPAGRGAQPVSAGGDGGTAGATSIGDVTSIDPASVLATSILQGGGDGVAEQNDGGSNWDDDDDVDDVLAGLPFDDADTPPRPAPTSPMFGHGAESVSPSAHSAAMPVQQASSQSPAATSGAGAIMQQAAPAAKSMPAAVTQPVAGIAGVGIQPPTASNPPDARRFNSLEMVREDMQDGPDDAPGASFGDDDGFPLEHSGDLDSWDVSGGGSADISKLPTPAGSARSHDKSATPAGSIRSHPTPAGSARSQDKSAPASARSLDKISTPVAAAYTPSGAASTARPSAAPAPAQASKAPSSARSKMGADLGLSSDEAPSEAAEDKSSDWD